MAVIPGVRSETPYSATVTWSTITTSDTGGVIDTYDLEAAKSFHQVTAGAATAQLQHSNDNTNWVNLGSALAANTCADVTTSARYIKISAVASATCSVIMTAKRRRI
jgi:hypothetical protein